jgi:ferritin-like metal-binding protein YciE/sporulation protein YlmC with PRC-barrel domain
LGFCVVGICGFSFLVNTRARDKVSHAVSVQSATPSSEFRVIETHRLTGLLGMTVVNEDSQPLGRMKDFILNLNTGRPVYAIISTGGFLGLGQRVVLVPAPALSMATTQKGTLAMSMKQDRWSDAPGFKRRELTALSSPAQTRRLYQYYGQSSPELLTQTGRESPGAQASGTASGQQSNTLCLASELLGEKLANNQGKKLGKICDLLLDLSGRKPALAVFTAVPAPGGTYAAPLMRFKRTQENRLALDANAQTFHQAAPLNETAWQGASDAQNEYIFRMQKHEPDRPNSKAQQAQALLRTQVLLGRIMPVNNAYAANNCSFCKNKKQKERTMERIDTLEALLVHELKDLYHAEKQLIKALPKVAKKASSPQLKDAIEEHLQQTEGHVERLEQIFEMLGEPAKGVPCKAMEGLLEEGEEVMSLKGTPETLDAGIILAAQKIEHYEIASYGTVAHWAEVLGRHDIKRLLGQTLEEEEQTDEKLTELAKSGVNQMSADKARRAA